MSKWTRQVFLEHSACVKERNWYWLPNHIVLNYSFGDAVSTSRWPNYIANYSQRRSVQRCLCAWKFSDRAIVHVCKMLLFNSILHYAPDIVTISAPPNWDQLCGYVYVAWPNYSNHCCRQQIKISWYYGYAPGRKWSQSNIVSAQSSCFNFKTISVSDFKSPGITN